MFAIAFDLKVTETEENHPKGSSQAYRDIGAVLRKYDFEWVQGSVYVTEHEDLANLHLAVVALKQLEWFPPSVRDVRVFRVEQWSDFTALIKDEESVV